MEKLLTEKELKKKYSGRYVDVYPVYDYADHAWKYEVRGVSASIRENYNLPEDCVVGR